jgi:hypothetical protein
MTVQAAHPFPPPFATTYGQRLGDPVGDGTESALLARSPSGTNSDGDNSNSNSHSSETKSSNNSESDNGLAMIPSQLCVNGLTQRARTWEVKGGSWTDGITIARGSVTHYIACPGHDDGTSCVGPWSRRLRRTAVLGLHCVFGGWVLYDATPCVTSSPASKTGKTSP